ncbi:tRNA exportin [Niveomyces insectorum RCEF 264]|uniref:Exportin-T n=1 Tax=Niveomyces insectorum RCEF 264 TaxID=1081102 RepID=A0A162MFZ3_9HYPO|nr:tRNA exportin [Niveomyces insectorum RCEF 264]
MDSQFGSQIEKAIEIAWSPTSDASLKGQAFDYLHQLRADPQAWQLCVALFTSTPRTSDVVRLISLEIVNNAVQTQALDGQSLAFLKNTLLEYIRRTYGGSAPDAAVDPPALQNKLTQTLTYLFVYSYEEGWETFIDDFLALTSLPNGRGQRDNMVGVMLYLRMLGSVHDEIADVMLARQEADVKRNNHLKDLVRERDMHKIARSWQELLLQYSNQNDHITEMTLRIMGKWVSWIDIALVINQDMLHLLFPLVGRSNPDGGEDKVRDAAIDTVTEIVAKKMKPADKIELICFLNLREVVAQLVASPPLRDYQKTPKYDTDLAEAVAKLVNAAVSDVVRVLDDGSVGPETRARAEPLLHDFLPLLLRFFADEYDEVCSTVIPALTDLLTFLRRVPGLPPAYRDMLAPILNAIVSKMRYDETITWGNKEEQTDEAEFQDLRKRLQNLQKSVAAVDQDLYIDVLSNLIASAFQTLDQQGTNVNWRDLDLALHELDLFGELSLPNQGVTAKSKPSAAAAARMAALMQKMMETNIAEFPHPAILLQYMEICNRYCAFFESHQEYIPRVLENFVRLTHHEHPRIRIRSWYLFHRVVKQLRSQVGNVAETIIQSISDLLPIRAEVPNDDADDDMSSDETDHSADALFNGQLYLFEAIGCVSSTHATPAEKQALYARSVMTPLFADMEQNLPRAKAGDAQAILQIHHIIMALGTLAYGFSGYQVGPSSAGGGGGGAGAGGVGGGGNRPASPKAVSAEFSQAAEVILIALGELNGNAEIRAACRSAFSRLLGVMGADVLPQLPQWIEGLLSQTSSKDEMAFFLRLLEQVVYSFKGQIYNVLNMLLTPLLQRVLGGLSEPISGTDDEIQLAELRREYLTFVQFILVNQLEGVLISEINQGFFETMISSVTELARIIAHSNLIASRLAFSVLARMTAVWGGPDVAVIAGAAPGSSGAAKGKGISAQQGDNTSNTNNNDNRNVNNNNNHTTNNNNDDTSNNNNSSSTTTTTNTNTTTTNNNNGPSSPAIGGPPAPTIAGFDRFVIDRFHAACWDVLRDPQFRPGKDAQSRQVLNEIAGLEQTIYVKTGDVFLQHLQTTLFPQLADGGAEFVRVLTTATDRRTFAMYLQTLRKND